MKEGQYTGSLRPIDASCRDDVIAVDSLVSTHDKGKDGGEWQPTALVKPGDTQPVSCYHSHFTLQQVTPGGTWWLPFYPSTCSLCQVT